MGCKLEGGGREEKEKEKVGNISTFLQFTLAKTPRIDIILLQNCYMDAFLFSAKKGVLLVNPVLFVENGPDFHPLSFPFFRGGWRKGEGKMLPPLLPPFVRQLKRGREE